MIFENGVNELSRELADDLPRATENIKSMGMQGWDFLKR